MAEPAAFDAAAYLARIGFGQREQTAATAETLAALHLAHLRAVPFENLDIALGRPIRLDEASLADKIVRRRPGGLCFERNGLFAALLRHLGFGVTPLAARFPRDDDREAPPFDYLTLAVRTAEGSRWLADVGARRDSFARPLPLAVGTGAFKAEAGASFRLAAEEDRFRLQRREPGGDWARLYAFSPRPHVLADFAPGCRFHQTSPDSGFKRGPISSRATPTERVALADRRLIVSDGGRRTERTLTTAAEERAALRRHFGIDLNR